MDDENRNGTFSLNELVLTIDLLTETGVMMSFYQKEFKDEDHAMPDVFTDTSNSDGVAISTDGQIWYKVQGLTSADGISSTCKQFVVNLDAAVAAVGIGYNSSFKIKFQQYDNHPITKDGFAFDDIKIYSQFSEYDCFDGIDNDGDSLLDCADPECNGTTDGSCSTGQTGICSAGTLTCQSGGAVCVPENQPQSEKCDNLDNDCDGTVDENLTRATTCGVGECAGNTGEEMCTAGTWGNDTCDPLAGAIPEGPPGDATCNDGLDNDCDSIPDSDDLDCQAIEECSQYQDKHNCNSALNCEWINKQKICVLK
jgi:hypothetical protein